MNYNLLLAKVAGIPVRINATFFLLIAFFVGSMWYDGESWDSILINIGFILTLFFCVLLHEFGHAAAAARFGVRTRDIVLLPIGGMARLERIPSKPLQEFVVAIAGPLVNVAIVLLMTPFMAWLFSYRIWEYGLLEGMDLYGSNTEEFVIMAAKSNIFLAVFNMIPAFPMDGGRVFRALLASITTRRRATQIATWLGYLLASAGILFGLYTGDYIHILLAGFIIYAAFNENANVLFEEAFQPVKVSSVMRPLGNNYLTPSHTLGQALDLMMRYKEPAILIFDPADMRLPLGTLSVEALRRGLKEHGNLAEIADYYVTRYAQATPDMSLAVIQHIMTAHQLDTVAIIHEGQVVGVVDDDMMDKARYLADKGILLS